MAGSKGMDKMEMEWLYREEWCKLGPKPTGVVDVAEVADVGDVVIMLWVVVVVVFVFVFVVVVVVVVRGGG